LAVEAPELWEGEELDAEVVPEPLVDVVAALLAAEVGLLVAAAALVWPVGPATIDVAFVHVVEDPGFTVKGAVWAVKPVESVSERLIDDPL